MDEFYPSLKQQMEARVEVPYGVVRTEVSWPVGHAVEARQHLLDGLDINYQHMRNLILELPVE